VDVEAVDLAAHVGALVEGLGLAEEEEEMVGSSGWLSFSGDARLVDALAAQLVPPGKTVVEEEEFVGSVITKEGIVSWRKKGGGSLSDPRHGVWRVVYPRDEECHGLLVDMLRVVYDEARGVDMPLEHCEKTVEDMVSGGDVWVYTIAGEPVSACYLGTPTRRGKCICSVGTRAEFRRNGYAEALVGEVCWRLLAAEAETKEGWLEYLTLFFEEGSSAARIYRRIGFGGGSSGVEIVQKNLRFE
jgi:GNAT superfamily N-acetyltransferase